MLKFCLGFIIYNDDILLLNREKEPWMGRWNGIGGKLEKSENGKEAMIRETLEETGFKVKNIIPKGVITWSNFSIFDDGMYIYFIEVENIDKSVFPIKTREGILDLKKIEWILDKNNTGICDNIPLIFENSKNLELFEIHQYWNNYKLVKSDIFELDQKYIKELM